MILFVFCCKKSHKSIIEVSFLADFLAFSAFSQFSALFILYVEILSLNFSKFRSCSFLGKVNFREVIEVKEVITPFGRSEVKANSFGGINV